jgi:hypothetical protein
MFASAIGIGAEERPQFQDAINHAAKALAITSARAPLAATSLLPAVGQDPVPPVRARPSSSCRIPSWLKYTLIGAAAAGGGYAAAQIGHDGGHRDRGGSDNDVPRR